MKKLYLSVLLLILAFSAKNLCAQQEDDLSKHCGTVSKLMPVLNDQNDLNKIIAYKIGWNKAAAATPVLTPSAVTTPSATPIITPATIAIQFSNMGYADWKLKFAVKDVTTKKMVVLDAVHNSGFGTEMLKANSKGIVWSGPVDNINDSFSVRVWIGDGDEIDKDPISLKDKK